jgi:hypothetical protein
MIRYLRTIQVDTREEKREKLAGENLPFWPCFFLSLMFDRNRLIPP